MATERLLAPSGRSSRPFGTQNPPFGAMSAYRGRHGHAPRYLTIAVAMLSVLFRLLLSGLPAMRCAPGEGTQIEVVIP